MRRLDQLKAVFRDRSLDEIVESAIEAYALLRNPSDLGAFARLTPRQRDLLRLFALDNSTKSIAAKLKISSKTVEFHQAQLKKRLKIGSRIGLVRFAIRVGLIPP